MAQTTLARAFADGTQPHTDRRATLSGDRYTSAAFMIREWEEVWSRCWLFAGLASDLAEAGDYFVYEIGHESVVVIRAESGDVQAFYNVCQHRGNRLVSNPSGALQQFACPYHGWRYDLDGTLCEVPDAGRFQPAIDPGDYSLKAVSVAVWAGMVWINLDPDARPLEHYLGTIMDEFTPYHFEDMVLVAQQTVSLQANWKTLRDNFLEQYHVDFIHPQHASLVDCCNAENTLWPYGHSATRVEGCATDSRYPVPDEVPDHLLPLLSSLGLAPAEFTGRVEAIRGAVQHRKRELAAELGFACGELQDSQLSDVWQYDIFPNTFMTVQAEELWVFGPRPHPRDPDQCLFDMFTLQIPVERGGDSSKGLSLSPRLQTSLAAERPERDCFSAADVIAGSHSLNITIDQDIEYLADMQAGLHSKGFAQATLNQDEQRVQHFHDWLDHWLEGEG